MLRLLLASPQHHGDAEASRRSLLRRAGLVALGSAAAAVVSRTLSRGRRHVLEQRRLLRLTGVTDRPVPPGADLHVEGVAPWQTPASAFFRVDTAVVPPAVDVDTWALRVHGMVDRPLTLTFADLLARPRVQGWMTLACVSNPVGGDRIGNAWWSGVLTRSLLAEAGVREGANAVMQTSADGWTCGTPLSALLDSRDAMLAVAMNGYALPLEHGYPVRTVVPGLYGFVSACKWVVDWEVTTFDRFQAYWTRRGWAEQAPAKAGSRIDRPREGEELPGGKVVAAGVAWHPRVGVRAVEVSLDGGPWEPTELGEQVSADTWVQWRRHLEVEPGEHLLRVRAVDPDGEPQTSVPSEPVPDGAQGWHEVRFTTTG
jgi:DMSO/TMAO reductase YedYZ molybdopterin-dependent catalytic subunit